MLYDCSCCCSAVFLEGSSPALSHTALLFPEHATPLCSCSPEDLGRAPYFWPKLLAVVSSVSGAQLSLAASHKQGAT